MTDDELKQIEARANAATPGPWVDVGYGRIAVGDETGKSVHWWDWDCVEHGAQDQADGTFIAHARTDIPSLIAAVRERDARIEAFKKAWLEWHTIDDANMCVTDELIEAAWALVGGTK